MLKEHIKSLIQGIMAGFCGFSATVIGSYSFKVQNEWYIMIIGLIMFLMTNNGLYNLNGVTITTILIFLSQTIFMLIWKKDQVKFTWIIGVIFIMIGVTILQKNKPSSKQLNLSNQNYQSTKNIQNVEQSTNKVNVKKQL